MNKWIIEVLIGSLLIIIPINSNLFAEKIESGSSGAAMPRGGTGIRGIGPSGGGYNTGSGGTIYQNQSGSNINDSGTNAEQNNPNNTYRASESPTYAPVTSGNSSNLETNLDSNDTNNDSVNTNQP